MKKNLLQQPLPLPLLLPQLQQELRQQQQEHLLQQQQLKEKCYKKRNYFCLSKLNSSNDHYGILIAG